MKLIEWWGSDKRFKIMDFIDNEIPDNSIDEIVTDPPYGYSFMGKDWDKVVMGVPYWKECLRVLKPGAFAFIMSAPRQDVLGHMIVNLTDAGFDMGFSSLYWTYASGFPKAMNIGKAVDKRKRRDYVQAAINLGMKIPGNSLHDWTKGEHSPSDKSWCEFKKVIPEEDWKEIERTVVGQSNHKSGIGNEVKNHYTVGGTKAEYYDLTLPSTPEAKALDGSYAGYQPKPAVEVILVCMKPLSEKTYVDQALKNGKGITWLDACRVPFESDGDKEISKNNWKTDGADRSNGSTYDLDIKINDAPQHPSGRFPANLLVSNDILNDGQNYNKGGDIPNENIMSNEVYGDYNRPRTWEAYGDSGSFSRYFDLDKWWIEKLKGLPNEVRKTFPFLITPKPSKSEKNKGLESLEEVQKVFNGQSSKPSSDMKDVEERFTTQPSPNFHPTVKPVKLFSYLIALGSQEGDIVLDPFVGSGTSLVSADIMHRQGLGYDKDPNLKPIIGGRIKRENFKLEDFL